MPFCAVPFIHSYVDTKGKNRVCCAYKFDLYKHDLQDWQGEEYQKLRKAMLTENQEWLPGCDECKRKEANGETDKNKSARLVYNNFYKQIGEPSVDIVTGNVFEAPLSYDLRMNNLCNLSCRMCGASASSQIWKEAQKYPELWPAFANDDEKKYNSMDITRIIDEAETMREVKLLGGEPTVQPEAKAILQRLIDVGNTSLGMNVTTNGTNINSKFYELLTQFKRVFITVSIDNYGKGHEYIRGPAADFETIWKNVKKIYELKWPGDIFVEINQTVMTFNIFDFWRLRQEANKQYPWCTFRSDMVFQPEMYSPQYIPGKWKDIAIEKAKLNNAYDDEKHIFDLIEETETNMKIVRRLKNYTPIMDFVRNQHLKDHFPITYELFKGLK